MSYEYKNRRTCKGLILQIAKSSSFAWARVVRVSDGAIVANHSHAPVGKLTLIYQEFERWCESNAYHCTIIEGFNPHIASRSELHEARKIAETIKDHVLAYGSAVNRRFAA